jgi:uncharacterized protein YndB with AHSA1/START domain
MAQSEIYIDLPPGDVFSVLTHAHTYPHWLVGCKKIRAVDEDWPQVDSRFHHTVGFGPIALNDSTKVIEMEEGSHLVLEARARPAGIAHVHFDLEPRGKGTRLTLLEKGRDETTRMLWNSVLDRVVKLRNNRSLKQLKSFVETGDRLVSVTPAIG